MMSVSEELVLFLGPESSLQSSSSEHRLQMLRSVTALYLQGAASHTEESIELFDQALEITDAVVAAVEERADVGLVDDGVFVPLRVGRTGEGPITQGFIHAC